jgi:hypothetical protein
LGYLVFKFGNDIKHIDIYKSEFFDKDIMKRGNISVTWEKNTFENLEYENITYGNQISILDSEDFKRYNIGMGYVRGQELGEKFNIQTQFDWLKGINYAVHKIYPGQVLPYHRDHYLRYKEVYKVADPDNIERIILFLEDWKLGQLIAIEDKIVSNWSSGDWVSWQVSTQPTRNGIVGSRGKTC